VSDVRALSRKALLRVLEKFPEEEELPGGTSSWDMNDEYQHIKLKDQITPHVKPSGCYELKVCTGMTKEDSERTEKMAGENSNRK